ncbi:NUDIX hydrolase [Enterococcus sp. LJL128]
MTHRLIAHVLLKQGEKWLVIKRSTTKRGEANVYAGYWDLPGGRVEPKELPCEAALRETMEETGLTVRLKNILSEDSTFDPIKEQVFTRLIYAGEMIDTTQEIVLDNEEHTAFRWIEGLDELAEEKTLFYLDNLIPKISI